MLHQDLWNIHPDMLPDLMTSLVSGGRTVSEWATAWAAEHAMTLETLTSPHVFSMPLAITVCLTIDEWPFVFAGDRTDRRFLMAFPKLIRPARAVVPVGQDLGDINVQPDCRDVCLNCNGPFKQQILSPYKVEFQVGGLCQYRSAYPTVSLAKVRNVFTFSHTSSSIRSVMLYLF